MSGQIFLALPTMQRTLRLADGPDEVHRAAIGKFEIGKYAPKEMLRNSH